MANVVTNRYKFDALSGINMDTADLRVLLLTDAGAVVVDDNFVDDVDADELTVGGYARQTLANTTVTEDDTNDFAYLDADDVAFGALATGETIGWAVLFRQVTNDADSPVYAGYDVTDTPTNGSAVTLQWNTPANGGVLKAA